MKNALALFSLACLVSIAQAECSPPAALISEQQATATEVHPFEKSDGHLVQQAPDATTPSLTSSERVLQVSADSPQYTMVKGTVDVQEAGMFSYFYQAECCGGGGWSSPFLREPMLYLSLAFIALLYVNRRSILRAMRRQHVATA